jgi:hypothetical protein
VLAGFKFDLTITCILLFLYPYFLQLLKEDVARVAPSLTEYFTQVPTHTSHPVVFAIVREVTWNRSDFLEFANFYKDEPGSLFDWPGAECIPICPGTGEKVPYSQTQKHLLVACNLQGTAIRGTAIHILSRIMPRILTFKGYEKMMGPSVYTSGGDHRCVMISKKEPGTPEKVELYPTALRLMKGNHVMPASMAYDEFHTTGLYKAFERMLDDDKAEAVKLRSSRVAGVKVDVGTSSGFGPSTYASK